MAKIDYIRITGILEVNSSEDNDVTFNIEYSSDEDFTKPKDGVITLRLSEFFDTSDFQLSDIETIAAQLIEQVLIRERDEERVINIIHNEGLPLKEWFLINTPVFKH